ncbi:hypothetical protein DFR29_113185 [Tahibacter aquaticus]|uniref:Uncharacterized protein n=1 Tax=Tahibacter aquaticus TaxID=520092 RepID=A0A4R6YR40_9GAMM|nr:hypothetical protein [Tahibacter aquaticus]TDR40483.1 hypothetical protein DFR29_113185 [Tahibacter aquaticus]
MAYVDPNEVVAPRDQWKLGGVLYSTGTGDTQQPGWAVCEGLWNGERAIGVRWNGQDGETAKGNPQSRGHPTWFILPSELEAPVLEAVAQQKEKRDAVFCEIESPVDYMPGAWRITARLSKKTHEKVGPRFAFPLPKLPLRMCRPSDAHLTVNVVGGATEIWGQFVEGLFEGHIYVHDIDATKDSADIESFKQSFVQKIMVQLQNY